MLTPRQPDQNRLNAIAAALVEAYASPKERQASTQALAAPQRSATGRMPGHHTAQGSEGSTESWPEPSPLPSDLPPVKAFDLDLLPASLQPWIGDISDRVQCPPDFPAITLLVALGAQIGRKVAIRPKRMDDWTEVANLWGCVVGKPGILKTPAMAEALKPLRRLETSANGDFDAARKLWVAEIEAHKINTEGRRNGLRKRVGEGHAVTAEDLLSAGDSPEEPTLRRYIVNDTSHEALGEILRVNPNGVLAQSDELIGLLKRLDREGMESARAFYLSAWTGKEPYTFDRIGRGQNLRIEACCISILGSIQPSVIGSYLRQAVAFGGHDGLVARLQMLTWPDVSGHWKNIDRWPDCDARTVAYDLFNRLDTLNPASINAVIQDGDLPYLRFDDAAQTQFNEWREDLECRLRSDDEHAALQAHFAKYRGLVPRLALILHIADSGVGPVSEVALLQALAWIEYLETHARRAYASVSHPDTAAAKALLRRLVAGDVPEFFNIRDDVYRKGWTLLATSEDATRAAEMLVEYDYLRAIPTQTGGRTRTDYVLNPRVRP